MDYIASSFFDDHAIISSHIPNGSSLDSEPSFWDLCTRGCSFQKNWDDFVQTSWILSNHPKRRMPSTPPRPPTQTKECRRQRKTQSSRRPRRWRYNLPSPTKSRVMITMKIIKPILIGIGTTCSTSARPFPFRAEKVIRTNLSNWLVSSVRRVSLS